jgi:hypothetical protein
MRVILGELRDDFFDDVIFDDDVFDDDVFDDDDDDNDDDDDSDDDLLSVVSHMSAASSGGVRLSLGLLLFLLLFLSSSCNALNDAWNSL